MHADRLHTGKQRKVPNLPEKMDSTSLNEVEGEVRRGSIKELASGYFRFLHFFFFLEDVNKPKWMRWQVGGGYFSIFITSIILCNLQQCSTCQRFVSSKKSVVVLIEPKKRDTQTSLMHLKGRKEIQKSKHL